MYSEFETKIEKSTDLFSLFRSLAFSHEIPKYLYKITGSEFTKNYTKVVFHPRSLYPAPPLLVFVTSDNWRSFYVNLSSPGILPIVRYKEFLPPSYSA